MFFVSHVFFESLIFYLFFFDFLCVLPLFSYVFFFFLFLFFHPEQPSAGPFLPTAQNLALFFSLSRSHFPSFFPLLGVFLLHYSHFAANWNHTTAREPKRAHCRAPAFKNTTKIPREDTQRETKRVNIVAGEGKKSEILGGPGEGRSRGRAVQGKGWSRGRTVPRRAVQTKP